MEKRVMRPMTVKECRHFLGRYPAEVPIRLLRVDEIGDDPVDLPLTARQAIESMGEGDGTDPVLMSSPRGIIGIWGFLSTVPPTFIGGLTSSSIGLN